MYAQKHTTLLIEKLFFNNRSTGLEINVLDSENGKIAEEYQVYYNISDNRDSKFEPEQSSDEQDYAYKEVQNKRALKDRTFGGFVGMGGAGGAGGGFGGGGGGGGGGGYGGFGGGNGQSQSCFPIYL